MSSLGLKSVENQINHAACKHIKMFSCTARQFLNVALDQGLIDKLTVALAELIPTTYF